MKYPWVQPRPTHVVRLNPHMSMYNSTFATIARAPSRRDGQRRRRNCRGDCRDSGASYPRRNAHNCARRRVSTTPVTEQWHTPDRVWQTTWRVSSRESDGMREAQAAQQAQKSHQHLGGTDYTRATAVRCCREGFPCAGGCIESPDKARLTKPASPGQLEGH